MRSPLPLAGDITLFPRLREYWVFWVFPDLWEYWVIIIIIIIIIVAVLLKEVIDSHQSKPTDVFTGNHINNTNVE